MRTILKVRLSTKIINSQLLNALQPDVRRFLEIICYTNEESTNNLKHKNMQKINNNF
jgi:hypothetical protein